MNQVKQNNSNEFVAQTPWLDLARRQSVERAELRAGTQPPLRWAALEAVSSRRAGIPVGLRLSWAVGLLALLVLSGATVTWAYLVVQKMVAAKPAARKATTVSGPVVRKAKAVKARRRARPAPAVAAEKPAEPATQPRALRVRKPKKEQQPARAQQEAAAQPAGNLGEADVIFGDPMIPGGGEVIIVSPPSKLEPLFSPEQFKQRGPQGLNW